MTVLLWIIGVSSSGVECVFELHDELALYGIFWVIFKTCITSGLPDEFKGVNSLDGRFVNDGHLTGRELKMFQYLVEMPQEKRL